MKTRIVSSLLLIALAAGALAAPGEAPFIDKELKALDTKVDADLAAGALTKPDGDELKREIGEVRSVEASGPTLTHATRRDLKEKISKIHKDLDLKESQAKALSSPSPTP